MISRRPPTRRCGAVLVLATLMAVVLMGVLALSIDYGYLLVVRNQLQTATDAAALAAVAESLDDEALAGNPDMSDETVEAVAKAVEYAALHRADNQPITLFAAGANNPASDVVVGHLANPYNLGEVLSTSGGNAANSVQVTARLTAARSKAVGLFFARVLGLNQADVSASSTASFMVGIKGFRSPGGSGACKLMPFAIWVHTWNATLAGLMGEDNYHYDEDTGAVSGGADGIPEMKLYPLDLFAGSTSPPDEGTAHPEPTGNFGTVDIGSSNNSTADLCRQILYGPNADDFAQHGGSLEFDQNGYIELNGDTGVSAGFKDEMASIIGESRVICLYETVSGHGNNATYQIVKFVGVRIMAVKMTGKLSERCVTIQPAYVIDATAIPDPTGELSQFVHFPPTLVR
jgi:Flp pilus assembly protein TadG